MRGILSSFTNRPESDFNPGFSVLRFPKTRRTFSLLARRNISQGSARRAVDSPTRALGSSPNPFTGNRPLSFTSGTQRDRELHRTAFPYFQGAAWERDSRDILHAVTTGCLRTLLRAEPIRGSSILIPDRPGELSKTPSSRI